MDNSSVAIDRLARKVAKANPDEAARLLLERFSFMEMQINGLTQRVGSLSAFRKRMNEKGEPFYAKVVELEERISKLEERLRNDS